MTTLFRSAATGGNCRSSCGRDRSGLLAAQFDYIGNPPMFVLHRHLPVAQPVFFVSPDRGGLDANEPSPSLLDPGMVAGFAILEIFHDRTCRRHPRLSPAAYRAVRASMKWLPMPAVSAGDGRSSVADGWGVTRRSASGRSPIGRVQGTVAQDHKTGSRLRQPGIRCARHPPWLLASQSLSNLRRETREASE